MNKALFLSTVWLMMFTTMVFANTKDITPKSANWPKGLKLYQFYDKEKEEKIHPQGHYTLYSNRIVTPDGNKFKDSEIDLALKKINYSPTNESEAIYIASFLARYKFNAGMLGKEMLKDDVFKNKIPEKIFKQISLPKATKTMYGYKINFYSYIMAESGTPEEWIKYYEVKIEPQIFEIKELKTIWNEKGRYLW